MKLLDAIREAGVVGCGGAGFPTHVKLNCLVKYLIVNAVECEPLLRTDRFIVKNKTEDIILGMELIAEQVRAEKKVIAIKYNYAEEISALEKVIKALKSNIEIFKLENIYPAGDEQYIVNAVTGKSVPPSGIPLDVNAVVTNVATVCCVAESVKGKPFTHKYLTVTGEVENPVIVYTPVGTSFASCVEAAGKILVDDYVIIEGGPLMGKQYDKTQLENLFITKTTSGLIIVPKNISVVNRNTIPLKSVLRRARVACIQCSQCADLCPRYLLGHPLKPHLIMRKLGYSSDIESDIEKAQEDEALKQALICCECGVCEVFACPMELQPRQVNIYVKKILQNKGMRYSKPDCEVFSRKEFEGRKVPTKRIASRLGLNKYYDYQISEIKIVEPKKVSIPLKQHIGVSATPVVKAGEKVECGKIIGTIEAEKIGAFVHATIDGAVTSVTDVITISREVN
ncbi:MAG: 4Fe-4S dicluster domain-containing protein [Spirochaetaceae bacterium]|nr:4Fe-4S dicluster domain-containing protein [Spirochaetaceae bacterium]